MNYIPKISGYEGLIVSFLGYGVLGALTVLIYYWLFDRLLVLLKIKYYLMRYMLYQKPFKEFLKQKEEKFIPDASKAFSFDNCNNCIYSDARENGTEYLELYCKSKDKFIEKVINCDEWKGWDGR